MGAFLFGELEEDLLAFGILEPLAVALEELVGAAFALDADEQRLQIVDPSTEFLGTLGEDAARGSLEEEEGRTRFELGILREQLRVSRFKRAQVFAFLGRQALEHRPAAGVGCETGRPAVELETAPFRGDRDA